MQNKKTIKTIIFILILVLAIWTGYEYLKRQEYVFWKGQKIGKLIGVIEEKADTITIKTFNTSTQKEQINTWYKSDVTYKKL